MSRGNPKWKRETWLDVFPKEQAVWETLDKLSGRELVIVATSMVDVGLAHLLSKRLRGTPDLIYKFLGVDGTANAPLGHLSARIDLALMVGLIAVFQHRSLHALRSLRNLMAHNVNMGILHPKAQELVSVLFLEWTGMLETYVRRHPRDKKIKDMLGTARELEPYLGKVVEASDYIVTTTVDAICKFSHIQSEHVSVIDIVRKPKLAVATPPPPPPTPSNP